MDEKGVPHPRMPRLPAALPMLLACALLALLIVPAAALAQPPVVETDEALPTGPTSELVQGTVEDAGEGVEYHLDYAGAHELWCQSGGIFGVPKTTPPVALQGEEAQAELTELQQGAGYCVELVAVEDGQPSHGLPVFFTAGAPVLGFAFAEGVSATAEALEAGADFAGQPSEVQARYGLASGEWCESEGRRSTPEFETEPAPASAQELAGEYVRVELAGLQKKAEYCAQILLHNETGRTQSEEQVYFQAGAPSAFTFAAFASGPASETFEGLITLAGQPTSYHVEYAPVGSAWCVEPGEAGEALSSPALQANLANGEEQEVSDELTGLQQGQSYCALLVAENETAESEPEQFPLQFTAGAPGVQTLEVFSSSPEEAQLVAQVNTAGQKTTVEVLYAEAGSPTCTGQVSSETAASKPRTASAAIAGTLTVTIPLQELTPGDEYCALVFAENESGRTEKAEAEEEEVFFVAGAPAARTLEAQPAGTSALLKGEVDPGGSPSEYWLAYGSADSRWCLSGGAVGQPEHTTKPAELAQSDGAFHPVQVTLESLRADEYCASFQAKNRYGQARFTRQIDFSVPAPPRASTRPVSTVGETTATLEGEIDPSEQETTYEAEFGQATSQWCSSEGREGTPGHTSAPGKLAAADAEQEVKIELTGLTAGSEYCARIGASNAAGNAEAAAPVHFKTKPPALPHASTKPVSTVGETTATLEGEVDPSEQETTYEAEFGQSASQWCSSEGREGTPEHTSAPGKLAPAGAEQEVRIELTGLAAGTEYCARISASNAAGNAETAAPARFKTAAAKSSTGTETGTTSTTENPGSKGGGEVLGSKTSEEPAAPQLGTQALVGTVSGTATVKLKGSTKFVTLITGEVLPDGSEIDAEGGTVRVTVTLPDGKTQTAEVGGGRFRIEQEADGFTRFVLTLVLSGCPRTKLPKGSASAASILRSQPLTRHLRVAEKGGHWGTRGRFVSTSVEGTSWITTDDCGRSIVKVLQGKVKVRNLLTHKSKVVRAGHSFTAVEKHKRRRHRRG